MARSRRPDRRPAAPDRCHRDHPSAEPIAVGRHRRGIRDGHLVPAGQLTVGRLEPLPAGGDSRSLHCSRHRGLPEDPRSRDRAWNTAGRSRLDDQPGPDRADVRVPLVLAARLPDAPWSRGSRITLERDPCRVEWRREPLHQCAFQGTSTGLRTRYPRCECIRRSCVAMGQQQGSRQLRDLRRANLQSVRRQDQRRRR